MPLALHSQISPRFIKDSNREPPCRPVIPAILLPGTRSFVHTGSGVGGAYQPDTGADGGGYGHDVPVEMGYG
jgi:hypothetical protein